MKKQLKPSAKWYIIPIMFGILGGSLGYVQFKDTDKAFAKRMFWVGLTFSILWFIFLIFA